MSGSADISGAFQRPTLVDYLIVVEHDSLDICLHLHVGALEVGVIGVRGGRVVHAELPGAKGDTALSLLARLPDARVSAERWTQLATNVDRSWRSVVEPSSLDNSPGRRQRLTQIRAELRELDAEIAAESGVYAIEGPQPVSVDARTLKVAAELFDWAVIEAYMSGSVEAARSLAERREQLKPGDLTSAANLERLRLRLLEDELAAGVAEVTQ